MESASVLGILSSWEVIASGLLLMFLLPLVFAIASLKSPVRRPVQGRGKVVRPAVRKAPAQAHAGEETETEPETSAEQRAAARRNQPPDRDAEDKA